MVANYVAAFVPHGVGMLHPFLHGHRRHRVGEEANGDILWAKFARRWPRRSPWAPSPAPLGSSPLDDAPGRRGGRGASSLVRPNQGVGRPLLGAVFLPGAGRIARGVVAICIASSSTAGLAKAWLAGDGSPLSPYMDSDPTNGMMDFLAMVMVLCR